MYETLLGGHRAEAFLVETMEAPIRELAPACPETDLVRFGAPSSFLSTHERWLRTSAEDRAINLGNGRDHRPVAMHYHATRADGVGFSSAKLLLYVDGFGLTDLGRDPYLVRFTTRPFGGGHAIEAYYENSVPTLWDLLPNSSFIPKPLVLPTPVPEPAIRW